MLWNKKSYLKNWKGLRILNWSKRIKHVEVYSWKKKDFTKSKIESLNIYINLQMNKLSQVINRSLKIILWEYSKKNKKNKKELNKFFKDTKIITKSLKNIINLMKIVNYQQLEN